MLVGKSLLFVHHPRTGGTSVRNLLMRISPEQYFPTNDPRLTRDQKVWMTHQGLDVCHQYAIQNRLNPLTIPTLVCIRNPYSMMLSEYTYLSQKWKKKLKANEKTFAGYLANLYRQTSDERKQSWSEAQYGRYQNYICVNGETPDNLTIARYENLAEDVNGFVADKLGITEQAKLPHKNASRHGDFKKYYTEKEEKIVYLMWKNVFESGLYDRYEGLELA